MIVQRVYTPNVLRAAQQYFNCPSLNGVDLDDNTNLDHWETRILRDELMASFNGDTHNGRYTTITRGYMLDTGWYGASTVPAEDSIWG